VSDLFCPATLVVARHAEAAFVEDWFSDEGGSLTPAGRAQAHQLADSLAGRRVASVYSSDLARAVQTAEIVAARLGVAVTACKSLREVFIGTLLGQEFDYSRIAAVEDQWYEGSLDARFEGGESGIEVVERHGEQFEEIADLHRGETVLVVGHQCALGIVIPTLAQDLTPAWTRDNQLENTESVELENDADGWVLRRWGSTPGGVSGQV
jgi:2,3-bisphosphoglycerate-dependent phosphoglycerate mutase